MLTEIFNDRVNEMTCGCIDDGSSHPVPYTHITERNTRVIRQYEKVKDFIIFMMDKPGYSLRNGGFYALNIDRTVDNDFVVFNFSFDKIGQETYEGSVHGTIKMYNDEIVNFNRDISPIHKKMPDAEPAHDIGREYSDVWEASSCQGFSAHETNQPANPIELSPNSFTAEGSTIEVACPELEIGKVDDSVLNIDTKRQAAQDNFLKKMNSKFIGKPVIKR